MMKTFFTSLFLFCIWFNGFSQEKERTTNTMVSNSSREIKVQLPRNYDPEAERVYPLVVVLDGDYLFEPVAGNYRLSGVLGRYSRMYCCWS